MIIAKTKAMKSYMNKQGFTGASLARKVNMSQPYVCQIINGRKSVLAPTAKVIYDALGCKFDDVFEVKERNNGADN